MVLLISVLLFRLSILLIISRISFYFISRPLSVKEDWCGVKCESHQRVKGHWYHDQKEEERSSNFSEFSLVETIDERPFEKESDFLYTSKIFKSEQRKEVLRLCEYTDPVYEMAGSTQFEDRIRKLLENGEVSRAAMYALFCRKIWRAVQILEESDQPEISLMISGFTEKFQSQWHLNAERNAKRYKDQHVRHWDCRLSLEFRRL